MNKKRVISVIILAVIAGLGLSFGNTLRLNHAVQKSWTQLEAEYRWRADLVPNLAVMLYTAEDTLQGSIPELSEARLMAVENQQRTAARAPGRIAAVKSRLNNLFIIGDGHFIQDRPEFTAYSQAQQQITEQTMQLLASTDRSGMDRDEPLVRLLGMLEETVADVDRALSRYNNSASAYNRAVGSFPGSLYSGLAGFRKVALIGGE